MNYNNKISFNTLYYGGNSFYLKLNIFRYLILRLMYLLTGILLLIDGVITILSLGFITTSLGIWLENKIVHYRWQWSEKIKTHERLLEEEYRFWRN